VSSRSHWIVVAPRKRRCCPALSLRASAADIFGPGQGGHAARLPPFATDLHCARSLFVGFLRRPPRLQVSRATTLPGPRFFFPSISPPQRNPRIDHPAKLSTLLPPDQCKLVMGSQGSAAAGPDRLHREHGRSTLTVSHNWFQRFFNQNFYASLEGSRRKV
jgi:hypothetical protein